MSLNQTIVNDFCDRWIDTWNNGNIDDFLELLVEDTELVSTLALRLIPESNGSLKGKQILRIYWAMVKDKIPDFKFKLIRTEFFEDKIIIHYQTISERVKAIAIFTVRDDLKVSKTEVSYV